MNKNVRLKVKESIEKRKKEMVLALIKIGAKEKEASKYIIRRR